MYNLFNEMDDCNQHNESHRVMSMCVCVFLRLQLHADAFMYFHFFSISASPSSIWRVGESERKKIFRSQSCRCSADVVSGEAFQMHAQTIFFLSFLFHFGRYSHSRHHRHSYVRLHSAAAQVSHALPIPSISFH